MINYNQNQIQDQCQPICHCHIFVQPLDIEKVQNHFYNVFDQKTSTSPPVKKGERSLLRKSSPTSSKTDAPLLEKSTSHFLKSWSSTASKGAPSLLTSALLLVAGAWESRRGHLGISARCYTRFLRLRDSGSGGTDQRARWGGGGTEQRGP